MTRARAFTTVLVVWVISLGAIALAAMQAGAFRGGAAGRESMARVRAYWAARAGVEEAIARLARDAEDPDESDAMRLYSEFEDAAEGVLEGSSWTVGHSVRGQAGVLLGPQDAHSKLNINTMTQEALLKLPFMTDDVAGSILDWTDSDDDVRLPIGAEVGQYQSLAYPYEPRNAPMRDIQELELVSGVLPDYVRGEDGNLNDRLDSEEDDGDATWPTDNHNGKLDSGWAGVLTASSIDGDLGPGAKPRTVLRGTRASDLVAALGINESQARVISTHASAPSAKLSDFVRQDLNRIPSETGNQPIDARAPALTRDQLTKLLGQFVMEEPEIGAPGRLNLNTCPAEVLEYAPGISAAAADALISERQARATGFASLAQLLDVPGVSREQAARLIDLGEVRSNVFIVNSVGTDERTGVRVELTATIDRSTLPVLIREVYIR
ncbi:MAG: general secretion pathway protein GspK [Phycisphaerae bacterium]|nr:general secretion pathway protein GspK [Phycisphaerae bacterium]